METSNIVPKLIQLIEPHTHAGKDYSPGAILSMDSDSADRLIAAKRAKDAPKGAKAENAPAA